MCKLRKFLTQAFVFNYNSDCVVVCLVFFCLFCFRKDGSFISNLRNGKDFFLNYLFYIGIYLINNFRRTDEQFQMKSGGTQLYTFMYPFSPKTPLPSRLPHNIEQNSLCCTGGGKGIYFNRFFSQYFIGVPNR